MDTWKSMVALGVLVLVWSMAAFVFRGDLAPIALIVGVSTIVGAAVWLLAWRLRGKE